MIKVILLTLTHHLQSVNNSLTKTICINKTAPAQKKAGYKARLLCYIQFKLSLFFADVYLPFLLLDVEEQVFGIIVHQVGRLCKLRRLEVLVKCPFAQRNDIVS